MDISVGGGDVFAPGFELAAARLGGVEIVVIKISKVNIRKIDLDNCFHEGTLSIIGIFASLIVNSNYFNWVAKL